MERMHPIADFSSVQCMPMDTELYCICQMLCWIVFPSGWGYRTWRICSIQCTCRRVRHFSLLLGPIFVFLPCIIEFIEYTGTTGERKRTEGFLFAFFLKKNLFFPVPGAGREMIKDQRWGWRSSGHIGAVHFTYGGKWGGEDLEEFQSGNPR